MAEPKTLTVIWGNPGVPCPMARTVRVFNKAGVDTTMIYGEPVEVEDVRFYRHRIIAGDLVLVKTVPVAPKPARQTTARKQAAPRKGEDS